MNDEENKTGLILTDYLCDAYNENNKTNISYEDMIGIFNDRNNAPLFRVNAIIESNYKTRFKNLYDKYLILKEGGYKYDQYNEFINDKEYAKYKKCIVSGEITSAYTLNQNFYEDVNNKDPQYGALFGILFLSDSPDKVLKASKIPAAAVCGINNSLNDYEITLSEITIRCLAPYFDTNDLIGKTIYLNKTVSHYYKNPIVKTLKLKVAGYSDYVKVNEFTKNKVNALQRDMIGKLIPLNKLNKNALKKAIENGTTTMDGNSTTYSLTYEALNLYHNIFIMVQYLLLAMLLIYFFIYSIKSIKEKSYQIGVFKVSVVNIVNFFL